MDKLKLPFSFDPVKLREDWQRIEASEYTEISNPYVKPDAIRCTHFIEATNIVDEHGATCFRPNARMDRCPAFREVYDTLKCELDTFRIHTLDAGGYILKHHDNRCNFESGTFRLHIPIQTNPDMELYLQDERIIMEEGDLWYLNFDLPHELINNGSTERVHLILDCRINDWWREVFDQCGYQAPEQAGRAMKKEELESYINNLRMMDNETSKALLEQALEDLKAFEA